MSEFYHTNPIMFWVILIVFFPLWVGMIACIVIIPIAIIVAMWAKFFEAIEEIFIK